MAEVTIELIQLNPPVDGYHWENLYRVTHVETEISLVVHTSIARTCAFNMMCGVPTAFYHKQSMKNQVIEEIREALKNRFYDHSTGFKMSEFFWCCSASLKPLIAPHFEYMFEWQSASEPTRPTAMFKFSLLPQLTAEVHS